jgi:hypothetical protein
MTTEIYKSKSGHSLKRPVLTEREYIHADNESMGYCLACGKEAYGVEPDAQRYSCESCGEEKVYGASELLVMGVLKIRA